MAKVKLIATGNSDNPAIFSPHPPSGDDILFLNNFSLTHVAGGYNSYGKLSGFADADTGAVMTTTSFATNLNTEAIDMSFDVEAPNTNLYFFRAVPSSVGVTTYTGRLLGISFSAALGALTIFPDAGNLIINVVDINMGGGGYAIIDQNNLNNVSVIINVNDNLTSLPVGIYRKMTNSSSTQNVVVINKSNLVQGENIFCNNSNIGMLILNAIITAGTAIIITPGTLALIVSGGIDFTTGTTFPIISGVNTIFDKDNFFIKTKTNGGDENLLYSEQYPSEEEVTYDVVFDYGNKKGKRHNPPLDMVAKGVQSGLGVGTAEMLRVSDVLDALRDSEHESAEHFRKLSTVPVTGQQIKLALNG